MSRSRSCRTRRRERQKAIVQYTKARETLQLAGILETLPAGAVRDERVDPATQATPALPALDRMAINRGWATPDEKKPQVVDRLLAIIQDPRSSPSEIIAAARALLAADQRQWERDRADLANKANGGETIPEVTYEQAMALVQQVEKLTGHTFMPPAMQQIEEDASRAMPEQIIPRS